MPKLTPPDYTAGEWDEMVRLIMAAHATGVQDSASIVGLGKVSAEEYAKRRAAQLIGRYWDGTAWGPAIRENYRIDEVFRERTERVIEQAIADGLDIGALHEALFDAYADIPRRALVISRTETALAYNEGALANYKELGVTHVEVMDGGTGGSCDECEAVNGQVWTVEEAAASPSAHPNCSRSFLPLDPENA
jgi:SPP1 gp7 family putative phage head morphogenesis protein